MLYLTRSRLQALTISVLLFAAGCTSSTTPPTSTGGLTGSLYCSSQDGSINRLDLASGQMTTMITGTLGQLIPDGRILEVTNDLVIRSRDGATSETVVAFNGGPPFTDTYDDKFYNPQLSPDGKYIAYHDNSIVYIVSRNGSLIQSFAGKGLDYRNPTWLSDGRLVVQGGVYNPGLWVLSSDFTKYSRFDAGLDHPSEPAASPDGTMVACIVSGHVWILNADGTGAKQLTTSNGVETFPAWSPDSKWIVTYASGRKLYFVPIGTGNPVEGYATYPSLPAASNPASEDRMDWK